MTISSVYLRIYLENWRNLSVANSKYQNFIIAFDMGGMFCADLATKSTTSLCTDNNFVGVFFPPRANYIGL